MSEESDINSSRIYSLEKQVRILADAVTELHKHEQLHPALMTKIVRIWLGEFP